MATATPTAVPSRWELAAETIAVKIRWFGLLVGYVLVNVDHAGGDHQAVLNAILALGAVYALLDTYYSIRGRVFLGRYPLSVSLMEALFIGLLCYYHGGLESSFRYYYLLSLICCAIRHSSRVTLGTYALHCASYTLLYVALPEEQRRPLALVLTLVVLGWVTWASDALALLLKHVGEHLARLNAALRENQTQLEARIAQRTSELQEAQAHVLHQEKMAAFGLLAAGIAHEVGNPLTAISSLIQMLQRRDCDSYTREKLGLVSGQLQRIQTTLRELVNFSRPASTERARFSLQEVLEEAIRIAKYYKRTKDRVLELRLPADLPPLYGVRDQFVQIFLNLVLNAMDATGKGGHIAISAELFQQGDCPPPNLGKPRLSCKAEGDSPLFETASEHWPGELRVTVHDDGSGIPAEHTARLFQPYFTTKKNGTGLGLFVTRKLVTDHGGQLEFESLPGEGTKFCLRFPVTENAQAPHEYECPYCR